MKTSLGNLGLTGVLLMALTLSGCTGEKGAPPSPATQSSEPTTPSSSPTPAASRLTSISNGSSACLNGVTDGERIAMTGPELRPVDGSITVTDVSLGSNGVGSLRLTRTAAVLFTVDEVRHPGLIVSDSLAELEPSRRPYVRGSKRPLVGTEFADGERGFVPLLEVRVRWPRGENPQATELTMDPPDLTIGYTDSNGDAQVMTEKGYVTLTSDERGC